MRQDKAQILHLLELKEIGDPSSHDQIYIPFRKQKTIQEGDVSYFFRKEKEGKVSYRHNRIFFKLTLSEPTATFQ